MIVEGAFAEQQLFVGKGAGSYPTGSAVLSDISALTYDYRYEYKKRHQDNPPSFSNEATVSVVVGFSKPFQLSISDFQEFEGGFLGNGQQNMRGVVKLEKIREWSQQADISVILAPEARVKPTVAIEKEILTYA